MSVTQNIEVSVSEGLMCDTLYGHAFQTHRVRPNNRHGRFSGVQHKGYDLQCSVGVAKLSVERGFLVLRVYNWGWITVRCTE